MTEKKSAIYARVSLDRDADDYRFQDPANQIEPLMKWAQSQGYEVVGQYIDKCSGGDGNRPEFQRLKKDGHQHKFDIVLVWSLDRFSREGVLITLSYIKDFKRNGVGIKSLQDNWLDTTKDNPFTELIISVLSWAANYERQRISERTRAGISRRRAIHQWHGGRPKGSKDKRPRKRGAPQRADDNYGGQ